MAGLLDFLSQGDAPLGLALLAAGGPSTDPNAGFGARLSGAVQSAAAQKAAQEEQALRRSLLLSQVAENQGQARLRDQQAQLADRKQKAQEQWMQQFGGAAPVSPTVTVQGGGGISGPVAIPAGTRPGGALQNMSADQIAMAKLSGIGDLTQLWQATQDVVEIAPGRFVRKSDVVNMSPQEIQDARLGYARREQGIKDDSELVHVPSADGSTTTMPRSAALRALGGGGGAAPPAPLIPTPRASGPTNNTEASMAREVAGPMGFDPAAAQREISATERDLQTKQLDPASRQAMQAYVADLRQQLEANPARGGSSAPPVPLIGAAPMLGRTQSQAEKDAQAVQTKQAESLAGQTGGMLKDSMESATTAVQTVGGAQRLVQAIDKSFTGPAANQKLRGTQIADMLGISGGNDQERLANTRVAMQELAKLTLSARKDMKGQGAVTEGESALAARAASGDIENLTATEVKVLAAAAERSARFQYAQHQRRLDALGKNPATAGQLDMYRVDPLPDPAKPARTVVRTGTYNGKKVTQYSDGSIE